MTEDTSPENLRFLGMLPNLDLRKRLPISVVLTKFVLLKKMQIYLSSSKVFEYNLAKELHEKKAIVLLCEDKSGKPLIFEEDGTPFRRGSDQSDSPTSVRGIIKKNKETPGGVEMLPDNLELVNEAETPLPLSVIDKIDSEIETSGLYRGFLEGRVKDDSYLLVLYLSNRELKHEVSQTHNQINNEIPSKELVNSIKEKLNRMDLNNLAECDGEFLLMALEKTAYSASRDQSPSSIEQFGWYPHTDEHDILLTVAKGLGDIGDRRAVPLLIELTNETMGFERSGDFWFVFIEALGNIGDVRATETLTEIMDEGPVSWGCATKSDASHATYIVAEALKKLGMTEEELEEEFGYKY